MFSEILPRGKGKDTPEVRKRWLKRTAHGDRKFRGIKAENPLKINNSVDYDFERIQKPVNNVV
jgi:hypothetical protein